MSARDELVPTLKKLRLSGILQSLDPRIDQAVEANLSHTEFLYRLLADEVERRDAKQLQLRLGRANFEHQRTMEDFNFTFNPKLPKAAILELCTCQFMRTHTNVLLIGPSGVGKSHVAQAIGHRACLVGHRTHYETAHDIFTSLRAGRGDGTYARRMARYVSHELLIIDDVGLRPLQSDEPFDLYELIRQRYERASTVFTSNRDVPEWYSLFGDPLVASAAMDRLLHHSKVLQLEGKSYRTGAR